MTIDTWLSSAVADASARGLAQLKPLLESLAQTTRALRAADLYLSPLERTRAETPSDTPRR
jgi:hypothetical protein